jgi:four helix bundle protein
MTSEIKSYQDLVAWQLAVEVSLRVYEVTARFPDSERYGLINQLRRAAVSIPSNIAEGYGRGTSAEYIRFLRVSRGSLYEVETQLTIATRLGYLDAHRHTELEQQLKECGRVLAGLLRSIESLRDTVPAGA